MQPLQEKLLFIYRNPEIMNIFSSKDARNIFHRCVVLFALDELKEWDFTISQNGPPYDKVSEACYAPQHVTILR